MPKPPKPPPEPKRVASVRALRLGYELLDPLTTERAIAEIAAAFEACDGQPTKAAERLEVGYKQINRWALEHPRLAERLNAIRAGFGWPALGGGAGRRKREEPPAKPVKRGRKAG